MIHVHSIILGKYPIRGFLAWGAGETEALFVDPGGWSEEIPTLLREQGLTVRAIVLTHGHWDHTGGLIESVARLQVPFYAHEDDLRLLDQRPDVMLQGGEEIACGAVRWRVLHTPGHTAGSVCYTAGDVAFTGDTLFAGSIGGTPSQAEYQRECRAIRTHLFSLGDATRVYPAHGPATTIGIERRCNPFLR